VKPVRIGDPVEVKFASYDSKRGRSVVDHWVPATVTATREDKIAVAFANGQHMWIERGRHNFRRTNDA
jgi:hypothetical protein